MLRSLPIVDTHKGFPIRRNMYHEYILLIDGEEYICKSVDHARALIDLLD